MLSIEIIDFLNWNLMSRPTCKNSILEEEQVLECKLNNFMANISFLFPFSKSILCF